MAEITTIARPYAQAVFQLAKTEGNFAGWSDAVQMLAAIAVDPQAAAVLASPTIDADQKAQLLTEVAGDKLNDPAKNFVRVLAANDRLSALVEIAALYEVMRNEAEGAVDAELVTAMPATEEQKTQVVAALKTRLGREIHLQCKTDESLLGGAIIRAGDLVIDGTARGKLGRLATALVQ